MHNNSRAPVSSSLNDIQTHAFIILNDFSLYYRHTADKRRIFLFVYFHERLWLELFKELLPICPRLNPI